MPLTKYWGLRYPTHFLKSRGSVIRNKFLKYRTKHVNIFSLYIINSDPVMSLSYQLQIKLNIYSTGIFHAPVVTQFIVKV